MPKPGDGDAFIGTGFIVENSSASHWLVTAAHVPSNQHPTLNFSNWRSHLKLFDLSNRPFDLSLFNDPDGMRTPLFKFFEAGGHMVDMMAIPLSQKFLDAGQFDRSIFVCLNQVIETPQPLGMVYGYGYPKSGDAWPYSPADKVSGAIVDNSGLNYHAILGTRSGHSGGPVFSQNGTFAGMMIGISNGFDQIISDRLLSAFVNDRLQSH